MSDSTNTPGSPKPKMDSITAEISSEQGGPAQIDMKHGTKGLEMGERPQPQTE